MDADPLEKDKDRLLIETLAGNMLANFGRKIGCQVRERLLRLEAAHAHAHLDLGAALDLERGGDVRRGGDSVELDHVGPGAKAHGKVVLQQLLNIGGDRLEADVLSDARVAALRAHHEPASDEFVDRATYGDARDPHHANKLGLAWHDCALSESAAIDRIPERRIDLLIERRGRIAIRRLDPNLCEIRLALGALF